MKTRDECAGRASLRLVSGRGIACIQLATLNFCTRYQESPEPWTQ